MRETTASVTKTLIGLNVLVYALGAFQPGFQLWLREHGALFAPKVFAGEPWRLLTAMFLHGDIAHLLINMYGFWQLGSAAEQLFGARRYLLIYFVSGLIGFGLSVLSRALFVDSLFIPSVGASGAIFGIAGALLGFLWVRSRSREEFLAQDFVRQLGFNLILLFAVSLGGLLPIDNYAHVGGLLGGATLAVLLQTRGVVRRDQAQKRQLGLWVFVMLLLLTIYSLYPIGSPGFQRTQSELRFSEGASAFQSNDFRAAKTAFEEVATQQPAYAEALFNLALSQIKLGENEEAVRTLRRLEGLLMVQPELQHEALRLSLVQEQREFLETELAKTPSSQEAK